MGMGLYLREGDLQLTVVDLQSWASKSHEIEFIQCNVHSIKVLFTYCHPKTSRRDFQELELYAKSANVLLGDLNINSRDPLGSGAKNLAKFAEKTLKVPILNEATHHLGGQPDHILIDANFPSPT